MMLKDFLPAKQLEFFSAPTIKKNKAPELRRLTGDGFESMTQAVLASDLGVRSCRSPENARSDLVVFIPTVLKFKDREIPYMMTKTLGCRGQAVSSGKYSFHSYDLLELDLVAFGTLRGMAFAGGVPEKKLNINK